MDTMTETFKTLYTLGYQQPGISLSLLTALVSEQHMVIVDTRFNPFSRNADWRKKKLAEVLGASYQHHGTLGNAEYKSNGMRIADFPAGLAVVRKLLLHQPVILLCACKELQHCHRLVVAEQIVAELGCELVHLDARTALTLSGAPQQNPLF